MKLDEYLLTKTPRVDDEQVFSWIISHVDIKKVEIIDELKTQEKI